jgi:hypothetical protein
MKNKDMKRDTIQIKRCHTSEPNVSRRVIWFEVLINGAQDATFAEVSDAEEYVEDWKQHYGDDITTA